MNYKIIHPHRTKWGTIVVAFTFLLNEHSNIATKADGKNRSQYLAVADGAEGDVVAVGHRAGRDDVVEAGEGEGKHGVELHAGVPLLHVAPPHPAIGDPRLHPPQHTHHVPPQDEPVAQPRQPRCAAAPRELPLPLVLLRFRPVGRVNRRAAHVECRRRHGLEREQIGNSAPDTMQRK